MNRMLINGQETSLISASERALQYGDGVFETIAIKNAQPLHWQRHMQRLLDGCIRLAIPAPDIELLKQQSLSLINQQTSASAVVKIIVSRGVGGRGYRISEDVHPSTIISISDWPDFPNSHYSEGVKIRSCELQLSRQPRLAGIKHLNRLEQVLARQEWSDNSIAEGIMCDTEGNVIEGTMSNLFLVQAGVVLTPELSACGVAGIMRQLIIEACEACEIDHRIEAVSYTQARRSDEVFITNSLIELWPVRQWDDKTYTVNGEITQLIINYINKKR